MYSMFNMVALLFFIHLSALIIRETLRDVSQRPSLYPLKSTGLQPYGRKATSYFLENLRVSSVDLHPQCFLGTHQKCQFSFQNPNQLTDTLGVKPKNRINVLRRLQLILNYTVRCSRPLAVVPAGGLPSFLVINMSHFFCRTFALRLQKCTNAGLFS